MRKPRFTRTFMLKSMELQLEAEAEKQAQIAAARQQQQSAPKYIPRRRR